MCEWKSVADVHIMYTIILYFVVIGFLSILLHYTTITCKNISFILHSKILTGLFDRQRSCGS